MQTFLINIEDSSQVKLFQLLAQQLGIEMKELKEEKETIQTQENGEEKEPYPYYSPKVAYHYEDILAIVAQFPANKKWTFSDLQDENIFPEVNIKKQLIDNKLHIMPNPSTLHQKILNLTSTYMTLFVNENNLGDVYVAPVSLKIDENNALEPDVIFISVSKQESISMQAIMVAPELVVEVISPSNYKKLREEKKTYYANFGVQEYWEIYPKKKQLKIEVLTKNEDTQENIYQVFSEAQKTGEVRSKVLEGFTLDIEKIFK